MAIGTFGTLRAAVASFLQRDDLTSHIPTFIELATARFSDELRTPEMEQVSTRALEDEWTRLPSDFRAIKLIETNGRVLEYRTPWQVQKLVELNSPRVVPVYTIQDMQFRVYPFPSNSPVELTYYAALPALQNDSDDNWLLVKRPDVYIHAAIAQARIFLHDDERVVFAQQMTDKFIAEANQKARHIAHGSAPLAVRVA